MAPRSREPHATELLPVVMPASPPPGPASPRPSMCASGSLLNSMYFTSGDGWVGVKVHRVEASGEWHLHSNTRLSDLVRALWPSEAHLDGRCRSMRFLNDFTKQVFVVHPTRYGILVRSHLVRALVEPSRVLFIDTKSPAFAPFLDEFARSVQSSAAGSRHPFQVQVVDCILCAILTVHELRLRVMRPVACNILGRIGSGGSGGSLLQVYPLKASISAFVESLRPMAVCLGALAHADDADRDAPDGRERSGSAAAPQHQHDSAALAAVVWEEMLESWAHKAKESLAEALELKFRIEDAARFLETSMDYMRNRLLKLELLAMVFTLVMGFGALVSGIFGMNLKSGLEDADGLFMGVVCLILLVGVIIIAVSFGLFRWSKTRYFRSRARFGDNVFFKCISDDSYILSLGVPLEGATLPGPALEKITQDLERAAVPLTMSTDTRRGPL